MKDGREKIKQNKRKVIDYVDEEACAAVFQIGHSRHSSETFHPQMARSGDENDANAFYLVDTIGFQHTGGNIIETIGYFVN